VTSWSKKAKSLSQGTCGQEGAPEGAGRKKKGKQGTGGWMMDLGQAVWWKEYGRSAIPERKRGHPRVKKGLRAAEK